MGEHIKVIKKDGDWWTGSIGNRIGIFPSNYVQPATGGSDYNENTQNGSTAYVTEICEPKQMQNISDEAKNQEEADTEVSEINTQPMNDSVGEGTYSRPMSTTSTTTVRFAEIIVESFVLSKFRFLDRDCANKRVKWPKL